MTDVSVFSEIQTAAVALSDKIGELAVKYGPNVLALMRAGARVDAFSNITTGIILAIICGVLVHYGKKTLIMCREYNSEFWGFFCFVFYLGALPCGIIGLIYLIDVWNWVGLFNPDLYIVHTIIENALNSSK